MLPQGTLAESLRAGGAGLGGYYTTTGVGTDLAKGKEEREIDGVTYIFEKAIRADVALIRAHKADTLGISFITKLHVTLTHLWRLLQRK